jgi:thymidylate synthase
MKILFIEKNSVAEAWANAVLEIFFFGQKIKTEYDSASDFPSLDSSALIHVKDPFSKPLRGYEIPIFAHKGDLYATESIKNGYIEEITEGTHDGEIGKTKSFPYTYHDRISNYRWKSVEDGLDNNELVNPVNQIEYIIAKLKDQGHSRRAQAITWRPHTDPHSVDPPCLQRLWARIIDNKLIFQTTWRSRDLFKAWGANVNGMLAWAKLIADRLNVEVEGYLDFTNSLHIYGKKKVIIEVVEFIERLMKRESDNYDAKYNEAFDQFKTTKFYKLFSQRSQLKKELGKITEKESITKSRIENELLEINKKINHLRNYDG